MSAARIRLNRVTADWDIAISQPGPAGYLWFNVTQSIRCRIERTDLEHLALVLVESDSLDDTARSAIGAILGDASAAALDSASAGAEVAVRLDQSPSHRRRRRAIGDLALLSELIRDDPLVPRPRSWALDRYLLARDLDLSIVLDPADLLDDALHAMAGLRDIAVDPEAIPRLLELATLVGLPAVVESAPALEFLGSVDPSRSTSESAEAAFRSSQRGGAVVLPPPRTVLDAQSTAVREGMRACRAQRFGLRLEAVDAWHRCSHLWMRAGEAWVTLNESDTDRARCRALAAVATSHAEAMLDGSDVLSPGTRFIAEILDGVGVDDGVS